METIPTFCKMFFRGTNDIISPRTKIAYAYDLRVFFEYMMKNNSFCQKYSIQDLPLSVLDQIKREDIEEYLEYLFIPNEETVQSLKETLEKVMNMDYKTLESFGKAAASFVINNKNILVQGTRIKALIDK